MKRTGVPGGQVRGWTVDPGGVGNVTKLLQIGRGTDVNDVCSPMCVKRDAWEPSSIVSDEFFTWSVGPAPTQAGFLISGSSSGEASTVSKRPS